MHTKDPSKSCGNPGDDHYIFTLSGEGYCISSVALFIDMIGDNLVYGIALHIYGASSFKLSNLPEDN